MIKLDHDQTDQKFQSLELVYSSMKNNNLSFIKMLLNLGYVDQIMTPCFLLLCGSHGVNVDYCSLVVVLFVLLCYSKFVPRDSEDIKHCHQPYILCMNNSSIIVFVLHLYKLVDYIR